MAFIDLVKEARSIRRFKERPISDETLMTLVDCVRYSPSGANGQKLKVMLINDDEGRGKVFPLIKWAGALKDWDGPAPGQRPSAYMVLMLDRNLGSGAGVDHGIAAQSVFLGARDMGLGACMIGAYDKKAFVSAFGVPEYLEPLLIIALGEPGEKVVVDDYTEGSIAYYRDDADVHHVPKRMQEDLIINL